MERFSKRHGFTSLKDVGKDRKELLYKCVHHVWHSAVQRQLKDVIKSLVRYHVLLGRHVITFTRPVQNLEENKWA